MNTMETTTCPSCPRVGATIGKQYATVHNGERVRQLLAKAERLTLRETGRDKYFRIVARVVADGVDVGEMLIGAGLAVPYDGGRKTREWYGTE